MSRLDETRRIDERLARTAMAMGNLCVDSFHYVMLFIIGATVVWSAAATFVQMIGEGHATIEDILLLFIYLELGAMVGIYFKTYRMPVRFLLYVSITVLTRVLIVVINEEHEHPDETLLYVSGAMLVIALATLVIRYGSHRFPSADPPTRTDAAPPESEVS